MGNTITNCECFLSKPLSKSLEESSFNIQNKLYQKKFSLTQVDTNSNTPLNKDKSSFTEGNQTFSEVSEKVNKLVCADEFQKLKVIGKGAFGKVYLVQHKQTKEYLAMKKLKKKDITKRKNQIENVFTEKYILQRSCHPFIVKLKYAFQTNSQVNFVMEYMPGGELFSHLKKFRRFTERIAKFYAAEVILALEYLHNQLGIIYRDLKPENILLDSEGHIRLTDFGLSKQTEVSYSFCGTPEYLAPEVIKGQGHGAEVDWWTLGCLIFEMVTGRPPFQDKNISQLYQKILYKQPQIPQTLSKSCQAILEQLLVQDPTQRLDLNWEDVYNKKIKPPIKPSITNLLTNPNFEEFVDNSETNDQLQQQTQTETDQQITFPNFTYKYDHCPQLKTHLQTEENL